LRKRERGKKSTSMRPPSFKLIPLPNSPDKSGQALPQEGGAM